MLQIRARALSALLLVGALVNACSSTVPATAPPTAVNPQPSQATVVASPTLSPTAAPTPSAAVEVVKVSPDPAAPMSDVKVKVVSFHVAFTPAALSAPAGKRWHLTLDLQDPLGEHNFTISSGPSVGERVFATPNVGRGVHEYDVPGLPAGTYAFVCTLHPETMKGTIAIT